MIVHAAVEVAACDVALVIDISIEGSAGDIAVFAVVDVAIKRAVGDLAVVVYGVLERATVDGPVLGIFNFVVEGSVSDGPIVLHGVFECTAVNGSLFAGVYFTIKGSVFDQAVILDGIVEGPTLNDAIFRVFDRTVERAILDGPVVLDRIVVGSARDRAIVLHGIVVSAVGDLAVVLNGIVECATDENGVFVADDLALDVVAARVHRLAAEIVLGAGGWLEVQGVVVLIIPPVFAGRQRRNAVCTDDQLGILVVCGQGDVVVRHGSDGQGVLGLVRESDVVALPIEEGVAALGLCRDLNFLPRLCGNRSLFGGVDVVPDRDSGLDKVQRHVLSGHREGDRLVVAVGIKAVVDRADILIIQGGDVHIGGKGDGLFCGIRGHDDIGGPADLIAVIDRSNAAAAVQINMVDIRRKARVSIEDAAADHAVILDRDRERAACKDCIGTDLNVAHDRAVGRVERSFAEVIIGQGIRRQRKGLAVVFPAVSNIGCNAVFHALFCAGGDGTALIFRSRVVVDDQIKAGGFGSELAVLDRLRPECAISFGDLDRRRSRKHENDLRRADKIQLTARNDQRTVIQRGVHAVSVFRLQRENRQAAALRVRREQAVLDRAAVGSDGSRRGENAVLDRAALI